MHECLYQLQLVELIRDVGSTAQIAMLLVIMYIFYAWH